MPAPWMSTLGMCLGRTPPCCVLKDTTAHQVGYNSAAMVHIWDQHTMLYINLCVTRGVLHSYLHPFIGYKRVGFRGFMLLKTVHSVCTPKQVSVTINGSLIMQMDITKHHQDKDGLQ